MTLRYSLNFAEFREMAGWPPRWWQWLNGPGLLLLGARHLWNAAKEIEDDGTGFIPMLSLTVAVAIIAFGVVQSEAILTRWWAIKHRWREHERLPEETILSTDDDGIRFELPGLTIRATWQRFRSVRQTARLVLLVDDGGDVHAVPKSAFASDLQNANTARSICGGETRRNWPLIST